jgi:hypothetical protein
LPTALLSAIALVILASNKNDPELEARITKAMAERRAVGKKDRGENQDQ